MELLPLLVAGYGRSGTTALMSLLATDRRVAMGRTYPFEDRYLTYTSKLALLLQRNLIQPQPSPEQMYSFEESVFGGFPWAPPGPTKNDQNQDDWASAMEWFDPLWAVVVGKARARDAQVAFYAEKVPAWVPAFVRRHMPARTFYLFRDPRDMYLSANAFMRRRQYFSFGRRPGDSDLEHATNLAYEFLLYFENFRADKDRADCMLVHYANLIHDRAELIERMRRFAGLQCLDQIAAKELESHRTSSSLETSLDRWRRERLPPGVLAFLETSLEKSMEELGYELSGGKTRPWPAVEFDESAGEADRNGLRICFLNRAFSIGLPVDPFPSNQVREVWVSLYGPTVDRISLCWQSNQCSTSQQLSLPGYNALHWRVLRFLVGRHEGWRGMISNLRLEITANPLQAGENIAYLRWVRLVE